MTDTEITRLCAESMNIAFSVGAGLWRDGRTNYDPLHNDSQAMALVKKFRLSCGWDYDKMIWCETMDVEPYIVIRDADDLNHAICECVAKMQQAKVTA